MYLIIHTHFTYIFYDICGYTNFNMLIKRSEIFELTSIKYQQQHDEILFKRKINYRKRNFLNISLKIVVNILLCIGLEISEVQQILTPRFRRPI